MKKQILLLVLLLSMGANAFSEEVEINGMWYNLLPKGKVATVIQYKNNVRYSGSIVIPESVEYNGDTYSVISIEDQAFISCSGLTSVTIPGSVTTIGDNVFYWCSSLTSVTIGNGVSNIGNYVFYGCSGLTSVHISDIAAWCKITFGSTVSNPLYYAHHLYLEEEEITDLVIPDNVTKIGSETFRGCSGLTSVTIPGNVISIGDLAFEGCSGLISVTIPNSVTSIGFGVFQGCSGLISVRIPDSVTIIPDGAFRDCSSLVSVTIPRSVNSIGEYAFSGCHNLTSFTIPNSVTNIGPLVFYGCNRLASVTIGSGVKNIERQAFSKCPELADVYCYAENVPSTRTDAYQDSYIEYATLHVPATSIDAYKTIEPWKNFKAVVALNDESSDVAQVRANTAVIQSQGSRIMINGTDDGTNICVYGANGVLCGSAVSYNGSAAVRTTLPIGSVVFVKIGDKAVKVVMR